MIGDRAHIQRAFDELSAQDPQQDWLEIWMLSGRQVIECAIRDGDAEHAALIATRQASTARALRPDLLGDDEIQIVKGVASLDRLPS